MRIIRPLWTLLSSYFEARRLTDQDLATKNQKAKEFSNRMIKALGYKLEVIQTVDITEPMYLVCNHQSTFDPIMVVASYPLNLTFISKIENKKIPIIKRWAEHLELIYFDRNSRQGNIKMLRQASEKLKNNHSVLVFPEGTRSKSKELGTLKAGALQPAKLAKKPILVVTLINSYLFSEKKSKDKTLKIVYGPILEPELFKEKSYEAITELITSHMQHHLKAYQAPEG